MIIVIFCIFTQPASWTDEFKKIMCVCVCLPPPSHLSTLTDPPPLPYPQNVDKTMFF